MVPLAGPDQVVAQAKRIADEVKQGVKRSRKMVDQLRLAVTAYCRTNDDWTAELLTRKEDILKLPEIECSLAMTAIYERTDMVQ